MPLAKRPRTRNDPAGNALLQLLHRGGISSSGLAALLRSLKDSLGEADVDLGDLAASRSSLQRVAESAIEAFFVQEQIPLKTGGDSFCWEYLDPAKLITDAVASSPVLKSLFATAVARHPPSHARPWSVIVGFDEFVPGNKLRVDNERKCMNLYFSFKELGQHALCNEIAWFTPVCVRASKLHDCEGGFSRFLRIFLRRLMLGSSGLATAGLAVELNGQSIAIVAKIGNLLSDGLGFSQAMDWRGASGLKPCLVHGNVWKKDWCRPESKRHSRYGAK
jgi:hypothetical protein